MFVLGRVQNSDEKLLMEIYLSIVSGFKLETMLKYIPIAVIFHCHFEPCLAYLLPCVFRFTNISQNMKSMITCLLIITFVVMEEADKTMAFGTGMARRLTNKRCRYLIQPKCEEHCDEENICVTACYDVTVKKCTLNKR